MPHSIAAGVPRNYYWQCRRRSLLLRVRDIIERVTLHAPVNDGHVRKFYI